MVCCVITGAQKDEDNHQFFNQKTLYLSNFIQFSTPRTLYAARREKNKLKTTKKNMQPTTTSKLFFQFVTYIHNVKLIQNIVFGCSREEPKRTKCT